MLVEPEIPPNTGNIARLCGATRTPLHLVGQLGFRIDEHAVRRAGLDYWHLVDVRTHVDLMAAKANIGEPGRLWLTSGRTSRSYLDVEFGENDAFVFGKESRGLDDELLERYPDQVIGIPTLGEVRSLNIANAVAILLFEALRRTGALSPATLR